MKHPEPGALRARLRRAGVLGAATAGGAALAGGCGGPAGPPPLVVHFRTPAPHYAQLLAGPATGDLGGAMSAEGGLLAVGDHLGGPGQAGLVDVFALSAGRLRLQAVLQPPGPSPHQGFGSSVAVGDGVILVGADQVGANGNVPGEAYMFLSGPRGWSLGQTLRAGDGSPGDAFGASAALAGATAVVGAPGHASGVGAAYVFRDAGGRWHRVAELAPGPGAGTSAFGTSVALEGGHLAVGAPYEYAGSGAVHLFSLTGEGWSTGAVLGLAPGPERADGRLGTSVAWWGARVAAGAPQAGRDHSGRVVIFSRSGRRWVRSVVLSGTDHPQSFGQSVAVAGGRLAVGAPQGFGPGQAFVFVPGSTPPAREWSAVELRGAGMTAKLASYDGFGTSVAFMPGSVVVGAPDQGPAGMLYVRPAAAAPPRRR